jgi:hypothetical protein
MTVMPTQPCKTFSRMCAMQHRRCLRTETSLDRSTTYGAAWSYALDRRAGTVQVRSSLLMERW